MQKPLGCWLWRFFEIREDMRHHLELTAEEQTQAELIGSDWCIYMAKGGARFITTTEEFISRCKAEWGFDPSLHLEFSNAP